MKNPTKNNTIPQTNSSPPYIVKSVFVVIAYTVSAITIPYLLKIDYFILENK